jgi:hypothetical protein
MFAQNRRNSMWDPSSFALPRMFSASFRHPDHPAYSCGLRLIAFLRLSKVVPDPSFELCFEHLLGKLQSFKS